MQTDTLSYITVDKSLVEKYLGCGIPDQILSEAIPQAVRKLSLIIEREGDADGERLKPYYLSQLVAEAIQATTFSIYCKLKSDLIMAKNMEKECTANAIHPLQASIL